MPIVPGERFRGPLSVSTTGVALGVAVVLYNGHSNWKVQSADLPTNDVSGKETGSHTRERLPIP